MGYQKGQTEFTSASESRDLSTDIQLKISRKRDALGPVIIGRESSLMRRKPEFLRSLGSCLRTSTPSLKRLPSCPG